MPKRNDGELRMFEAKACPCCEAVYTPTGSHQKRCPSCAVKHRADTQRASWAIATPELWEERRVKARDAYTPKIPTLKICDRCEGEYMPTGQAQKVCPLCRYSHNRAVDNAGQLRNWAKKTARDKGDIMDRVKRCWEKKTPKQKETQKATMSNGDKKRYRGQTASFEGRDVYFIQRMGDASVKIGYSRNPLSRLKAARIWSSTGAVLLGTMYGGPAMEKSLHKRFGEYRELGEWYRFEGDLLDWYKTGVASGEITKHADLILPKTKAKKKEYDGQLRLAI